MSTITRKIYRRRLLAILIGLGLWAFAGWAFIAGGAQQLVVCEHAGPATITCWESESWLGHVSIGQDNVMTPIQAAERELSCHTDSTTPGSEYVCEHDTVRVFTPDTSYILFQSLPEEEAQAKATRINHFIHRDTDEEQLIFEEDDLFEFWTLLFLVTLPMLISGGIAFWLVLSGRI